MKYWYLKKGDVLGPMGPEEIAKDRDFNAQSLVCPENESANEASWQYAVDYVVDFGKFLMQTAATVGAPAKPRPPAAPPKPARVYEDKKTAQAVKLIEEISPEDTIHSRSPLTAALEDNLLDDLPASSPFRPAAPALKNIEEPVAPPKLQSGAISIFDKRTLTPDHSAPSGAQAKLAAEASKKNFRPTTDGKIINTGGSAKPQAAPPKKSDTIYILLTAMFAVIVAALFLTVFHKGKQQKIQPPATAAQTQEQPAQVQAALQGIDEITTAPEAKPQEPIRAVTLTNQSGTISDTGDNAAGKTIARQMVREYLLDERRGTIEEFFKKTYAGYNTAWSALHMYEDSFVVEYHASKVRQEPIKYMFRVNIKNRQIAGMNTIAIDLLSK